MTAPSPAPSGDPVRSGGVFSGPTAIQTGDHSVQHNHFHPVPRPMPRQIGVLPRRADCYQYRAEIRVLEEALDGGGTAVLGQVVTGMGGVGKTQLAAHYARQAQAGGRLDLLVWITAATRTAVVDGYARAAVQLLDQDPGDPEAAAQAFLAWLEAPVTAALRWLVVLDDLADLADLRDLWPPESPSGRILVTTRRRDAALVGSGRRPVAVGLFTVDEAVEYLGAVLAVHGHRAPAEDLAQLAEDLGRLPLALSQAAAYLVDAGLDCRTYRRLLADRATALADALPEPSSLPDDQRTTVAAAWSMSLERADAMRPQGLARPVLQLAAMLDPNGIPGAVLTDDAAVARFGAQRGGPGDGGATAQEVVGSLRVLHRLSLIDHVPDHPHHTVRVHQLVQRSVREEVPARERDSLARAAADVLVAAWPEIERDTGLAAALRANTAALARHAAAALGAPVTHPLLFRAGRSLGESGQTGAAAAWFDRLAGDIADTLGPDHPEILTARHDRAFWQAESGDVQGAIDLLGEVLGERTRRLGADHIDTLTARHNLAWWRGRAGDVDGAIADFTALMADHLRTLGPDHHYTLTARHNLAHWRGWAGDPARAAAELAEVLADRVRLLGPEHVHTLTTRHNLAHWEGMAGDAARAAAAFADVLAMQTRVLGPDHPETLTTRHSLARWLGESGEAAAAAAVFAEVLADRERVLGPDHPRTRVTRSSLAHWRRRAEETTDRTQ